jgi:hypothetical protein
MHGEFRVYEINLLGEFFANKTFEVELYYDGATAVSDTYSFTPTANTNILKIKPRIQRARGIQLRLSDGASQDESFSISSIGFSFGVKSRPYKFTTANMK